MMKAKRVYHGGYQKPEYKVWTGMIRRCYRPNAGNFYLYGAQGVRVCDRWLESFQNFLDDMGPRPSPSHSIDRYPDTNGNYEPGNCRWATPVQQTRGRRVAVRVDLNGQLVPLADACEAVGVNYQRTYNALKKGLPFDEAAALPAPPPQKRRPRRIPRGRIY